jgi:hypothetical protein
MHFSRFYFNFNLIHTYRLQKIRFNYSLRILKFWWKRIKREGEESRKVEYSNWINAFYTSVTLQVWHYRTSMYYIVLFSLDSSSAEVDFWIQMISFTNKDSAHLINGFLEWICFKIHIVIFYSNFNHKLRLFSFR